MPKKWVVNDKKAEARLKEKQAKEVKREKEQQEKESKEWEETDKHALKKLERKREEQEKKEAALKRKQEKRELYEKELMELSKGEKAPKITQFQAAKVKQQVVKETLAKTKPEPAPAKKLAQTGDESDEDEKNPIPENINHIRRKEEMKAAEAGIQVVSASGLEAAMKELAVDDPDRHPERRMKKALEDYQDKMMPKFKAEYPGLKRSQYMNMIYKEWKASPENPMNKSSALAYNSKV